jgi:hypothetical protein
MSEIRKDAKRMLGCVIDKVFVDLHAKNDTKHGDITPQQLLRLNELKDELADLMTEQVEQNL